MKPKFLVLATLTAAVLAMTGCGAAKKVMLPVHEAKMKSVKLDVISTYKTGVFDESAAEITSYDKKTKTLFFVNAHAGKIEMLDISNPEMPKLKGSVDVAANTGGAANSIDIRNGLVAVAVEAKIKQNNGYVVFMNNKGEILNKVTVGALPDMVKFSPDGKFVMTANEGEPNKNYSNDPKGSVSIIPVADVKSLKDSDVKTLTFDKAQFANHPRISGPNASPAQDVEPEYIAFSADSRFAFVSLQENNAIARINLTNDKIVVKGLGYKDHSKIGNGLDAVKDGKALIKTYPLRGLYMPDAIASATIGGKTYILSANEGDGREYGDYEDETKIGKVKLDYRDFKYAKQLQKELKKTKILKDMGDFDNDGRYDALYTMGGRSFTIWDAGINKVYDSGDFFERIGRAQNKKYFNTSNSKLKYDDRSPKKGPEPEGVETALIDGAWYAFIGLERVGGIVTYNISDVKKPRFVNYINNRNFDAKVNKKGKYINPAEAGDLGPEGIHFIDASVSPNGQNILAVANEVSGTITLYSVTTR